MVKMEGVDLWTWENCKSALLSLPGRLGFPEANVLQFLDLEVNLKDGRITDLTLNKPFDPKIEYIFFLLNQYSKAEEIPLTGEFINYQQISGGRVYAAVFESRATKPVEKHLSATPNLFHKAALTLKGKPAEIADIAYSIYALPRVPYTYALWLEDEEFPARVRIYLDGSASSYLDAEAHAHLASLVTIRLLVIAGSLAENASD